MGEYTREAGGEWINIETGRPPGWWGRRQLARIHRRLEKHHPERAARFLQPHEQEHSS